MKALSNIFGAFCSTLAIIYCLSIGHFMGAALFAVPLYLFSITIQKRQTMETKIKKLVETISRQTLKRFIRGGHNPEHEYVKRASVAVSKPGKLYTKIDVGDSGKYMIENATGEIYGIKAYGVIHRGHHYGNLDTIDSFYWGGYTAIKLTSDETTD